MFTCFQKDALKFEDCEIQFKIELGGFDKWHLVSNNFSKSQNSIRCCY